MSRSLENRDGAGFAGIARALRGRVTRGLLRPEERLPPIAELAQEYGTTPITVRRALRELEEEGLVRVEHGVGTFVADWRAGFEGLPLPSFSAEMAARSLSVETRVLGRSPGIRQPVAALALGLSEEAGLAVLTRLRVVEGAPVVFQRSYLPEALAGIALDYSPERSLYEMLRERTSRLPAGARERLRATGIPEEAAGALGRRTGEAGLASFRITIDTEGDPLVYDEAWFPGDAVEIRAERRAGRATLEYRMIGREEQSPG